MIVFKDKKNFQERKDVPNDNWLDDDQRHLVYVVPDGSELADKIKKHTPHFEFVVDNEDNLLDIEPIERPPTPPLEPTQEDYLLDLDYRLSMVELGLS